MATKVGVVDYGAGNLLNVVNALKYCGAHVYIITNPEQVIHADKIILPGVGAFQDGMNVLREKNLIEPIIDYIATERPYLGICLGMQFLFEASHEFGVTAGLDVIKGEVIAIPSTTSTGTIRRVPHVGWASIESANDKENNNCRILNGITGEDSFYFVHSFMCVPKNSSVISSITEYMGLPIVASISYKNVYGTQFHPEKSGESGLKVLKNFLQL
ncbi:MAG: imidazole glycerol phosphate synthase subunit HisH [Alphaproteobacteria bacterium]|nr:imidazole glycerol phosphate synthase subunit HisH [Alphaproteobacteria bacterium]